MELFVDDLFVGCFRSEKSRTQGAVVLFILSNAWGHLGPFFFNPLLSRWNWIPSPFAMPFVPVPKGKRGSRRAELSNLESGLGHGDSIGPHP